MFDHNNKDFPQHLKAALANSRMSQKELAERCGVSETSVSLWISGTKKPRPKMVMKLDQIFEEDNVYLKTATLDQIVAELKRRDYSFSLTK